MAVASMMGSSWLEQAAFRVATQGRRPSSTITPSPSLSWNSTGTTCSACIAQYCSSPSSSSSSSSSLSSSTPSSSEALDQLHYSVDDDTQRRIELSYQAYYCTACHVVAQGAEGADADAHPVSVARRCAEAYFVTGRRRRAFGRAEDGDDVAFGEDCFVVVADTRSRSWRAGDAWPGSVGEKVKTLRRTIKKYAALLNSKCCMHRIIE